MRTCLSTFGLLLGLSVPALGQTVLEDPVKSGEMMEQACVPDSLDFDALFAGARDAVSTTGLPVVSSSDESAMFGNPGGAHFVVSRRIDSMSCYLNVPKEIGTQDYYSSLRDRFHTAINTVYPKIFSEEMNKPSPHEAAHQWVWSKSKDRHFAVSMEWIADRGVTLAVGYSQKYD